jgi:Zn-dependent metalloprotease
MTAPLYGVVPPYILRAISRHGSIEQKEAARENLAIDEQFRQQRMTALDNLTSADASVITKSCVRVRRKINTADGENESKRTARSEGQPPTNDQVVNQAYDRLGIVHDFFCQVYRRHAIDNRGMNLTALVHYLKNYTNAFWDPVEKRIVFGDGNDFFNPFTSALDIIGHEYTHGIIAHEAGLEYRGQPGALNESIADVFGSLIKQYHDGQTADRADWLIGAGIFTAKVNGAALRSMKEPGSAFDDPVLEKDPQPAHMDYFVRTKKDSAGVHINSGIPNHAFYLTAMNIGGNAWERAGLIWYNTLCDKTLSRTVTFLRFANRTLTHADILFGRSSREREAVRDAWAAVGIPVK